MAEALLDGAADDAPRAGRATTLLETALPKLAFAAVTVGFFVWGYLRSQRTELEELVPLFTVALALALAPALLAAKPDPFSPPSFTGLLTTVGSLLTAFSYYVTQQGVRIPLVPSLSGASRVELIRLVLIATIVGHVAYLSGFYFSGGRRDPRAGAHPPSRWDPRRLRLVYAVCGAAFLPTYMFFQSRVGVDLADVTELAKGKAVWREDESLSWMLRGVVMGFMPSALYLASVLPKPTRRQLVTAALLFLAVSVLVTRLGQRGFAFYFATQLAMIVHYGYRRIPVWVLLVGGLFAMGAVNELGRLRAGADTEEMEVTTSESFVVETLARHENDRQRMAAHAVVLYAFPDRHEYLNGRSWVGLPTFFVPRWLWAEKKQAMMWADTGIVFQLTGFPAPSGYPATLFANFGWAGVVLGLALFGWFHRVIYDWMLANPNRNRTVCYAFLLGSFTPTMLGLSNVLQFFVPALVAILFVNRREEAPEPARLR